MPNGTEQSHPDNGVDNGTAHRQAQVPRHHGLWTGMVDWSGLWHRVWVLILPRRLCYHWVYGYWYPWRRYLLRDYGYWYSSEGIRWCQGMATDTLKKIYVTRVWQLIPWRRYLFLGHGDWYLEEDILLLLGYGYWYPGESSGGTV